MSCSGGSEQFCQNSGPLILCETPFPASACICLTKVFRVAAVSCPPGPISMTSSEEEACVTSCGRERLAGSLELDSNSRLGVGGGEDSPLAGPQRCISRPAN